MRSYLLYSSSAHFILLLVLFFAARNSIGTRKEQAYFIDFIGASSVVTMTKAPAKKEGIKAPPAPKKKEAVKAVKAPPVDDDFISAGPLPKPSILSSGDKLFEEAPVAAPSGGEEGGPLIADAANFPYPWYITQVREALWTSWMERMPSGGTLRCMVRFIITRDGAMKKLSVEKSSGNRLFDNAAESSARAAAPFQPLPDDFPEDRLTVHVEFKAGD